MALPGGYLLVDFLGRMKPDPSLSTALYGRALVSPIGLGAGVDPDALAIGALGRFGFGFIEVGPLTPGLPPYQLGARDRGPLICPCGSDW